MNDLFRFIGDEKALHPETKKPLGYKTGQVYMLELTGRGAYMPVLITAPIVCLYDNWNAFLANWERI